MIKKILLGLLILVVLVLVFHSFIIGTIVKPQAEQIATKLLGTDVKISVLSVRLWPGNAAVYGLKIKNPEGFSSDNLLDLGSASVALDVQGLIKQITSGTPGPKTVVVDEISIRNLKLLVERVAAAKGPVSNLEKLAQNATGSTKPGAEAGASTTPQKNSAPTTPAEWNVELKHFSFQGGRVTVNDKTIGSGFEYLVDKINVDVKNIYFPAKPADQLVETLDISANIGKQSSGSVSLQGKSNLMAGPNIDAKLMIKDAGIADFNAFVAEQPFQIAAGKFNLESTIRILNNQLQSQHGIKLSSLELSAKSGKNQLIDLPLQTLLTTVSRLPTIQFPFEVNGDLKNPQFKVTQAIKAAIANGIQKVLAGGLGDITGVAKELKSQALGMATESTSKIAGDAQNLVKGIAGEGTGGAQKLVKGIAGEGSQTLQGGIKKLSGLLGKAKES